MVTAWLQPQFLAFDVGAGVDIMANSPSLAASGPPPSPPPGDAIPQMVLADPLKREDVVDCGDATLSRPWP